MLRGTAFEDMNFLDFTVDTYEIKKERRDDIVMDEKKQRRLYRVGKGMFARVI
jgi:hypothetical protein